MKKTTDNLIYRCGQLLIDPQLGQVKAVDDVIRLGPVNMKVLVALIEQQGQVVSRAQLFDSVWPNQIVNDDVLTRCISDLRTQLTSLSEFPKLIETIPKRGYRWLPEVFIGDGFAEVTTEILTLDKGNSFVETSEDKKQSKDKFELIEAKSSAHSSRLNVYLYWFVGGILGLLLISTSTLWLVDKLVQSNLVRVALLPMQITQQTDQFIASELDDILRAKLLETKGLRFLARSAVASRPQNPFPYFAHEFATRWIIEGQVSSFDNKIRISMSLVDAKTAIVYFSKTENIKNTPVGLKSYCDLFIKEMTEQLDLSQ